MRAAIIERQGTPVHEVIRVVDDWPDPVAGSGELVVRVEASALNHLDLWVGMGVPGMKLQYPRISGSDVCGIIETIGDGVDESWIGRRVIINAAVPVPGTLGPGQRTGIDTDICMIGEHDQGGLCERVAVPASQVVEINDDRSPSASAAFGLTFLTAWRCLVTKANIRPGQTILITGIGGGVALAGLAIAQYMGCKVIVTSRHEWKLTQAMEMGAYGTIMDEGADWSRHVRQLTDRSGVNIVLDSVGKSTHLSCIKSLCRGGTYVTPGCTTGSAATTDLARIFWNQLQIMGSTMGTMEELQEVTALFRARLLNPTIDSTYEASDAAEAFKRLESGEQFGKVVIDWTV